VSRLRDHLGRRFVVTWEVNPPTGGTAGRQVEHVASIQDRVDAVNVSDGAMARLRTSPIPVAARIQQETGIETIFHLTTRDRNVLALQSELLGGHLLGLRNVLALTGDPPKLGDHPDAKGVYELWGNELIALIKTLNGGRSQARGRLEEPTDYAVATALNFHATDEEKLRLLRLKIEAGTDFFQTQATYEPAAVGRFLARQPVRQPILFGIVPPRDAKALDGIARIPGVHVPDEAAARVKRASDFNQAAVTWLTDLVEAVAPHVDGIHIMPIQPENPVAHALLDAVQDLRGRATTPDDRRVEHPIGARTHG
jgi:5,10-methylenetetrahydrofolate reductase